MQRSDAEISALFTTDDPLIRILLGGARFPWELLAELSCRIVALGRAAGENYRMAGENIFLHKSARIAPSAVLAGPCIVGKNCELRQGCYVRGGVYLGEGCVVGNSCELKNCILFEGCKVPHFNYVGDSVLGRGVHLGAGVVLSNLKGDASPVSVAAEEGKIATGLKKCGSFLGDGVEVGCNAVLNPGTVVGKNARIYPLVSLRGYTPPGAIVKK